jgi:hypothetical protein
MLVQRDLCLISKTMLIGSNDFRQNFLHQKTFLVHVIDFVDFHWEVANSISHARRF